MSGYRVSGSCLCQKVSYQITAEPRVFQYCNCSRCRKFTGSAFAANLMVLPEDFKWLQGEEYVGRYELPDARHFATSFCTLCGSSLPWATQSGTAVMVPAGTLDDDPVIRPSQGIFCASRAVWYTDPATLPMHDELPPKKPKP